MRLKLKDIYPETISLRKNAKDILERVKQDDIDVIDFTNIKFISRSFAHELISNLPQDVDIECLDEKVQLMFDIVTKRSRFDSSHWKKKELTI